MSSTGRRLQEAEIEEIRRCYVTQESTFGELRVRFSLSKGGLSHILKGVPKHGLRRPGIRKRATKLHRRVGPPLTSAQRSAIARAAWERRNLKMDFSEMKTDRARRNFIVLREGHRCQSCTGEVWLTRPIPLELDHIDGNPENNTRENCRVICPNCHALTDTYKGRNTGRVINSKRQATMAKSIGKYR